jgi:hypothetical protein
MCVVVRVMERGAFYLIVFFCLVFLFSFATIVLLSHQEDVLSVHSRCRSEPVALLRLRCSAISALYYGHHLCQTQA